MELAGDSRRPKCRKNGAAVGADRACGGYTPGVNHRPPIIVERRRLNEKITTNENHENLPLHRYHCSFLHGRASGHCGGSTQRLVYPVR